MARKISLAILLGLGAVLSVSCGGGGGGSGSTPPPPTPPADLFGVWAGTWTGTNTPQGLVTGTWEAELVPSGTTGVAGTATLRGDVDCMDGVLAASVDANNVLTGTLNRSPCFLNNWVLTALDLSSRNASGVWTQPAQSGEGTLTGVQVAKPGGPRIHFLNPAAGLPNALVTIVGTNLGALPTDNAIAFDVTSAATLTANSVALTARVPVGASTGQVFLNTARGLAISPTNFSLDVAFPQPVAANSVPTVFGGSYGIAMSPDGRKAYSLQGGGFLALINTANNVVLGYGATFQPTALVAAPNGRYVYTVSHNQGGIAKFDAATAQQEEVFQVTIPGAPEFLSGSVSLENPQAIGITRDGRHLLVSDNRDGGLVAVIDSATKAVVTSFSMGTGWMPFGIAMHPDGRRAYIAFADVNASNLDMIKVFDIVTMTPTAISIPVGGRPKGIAVTPDGARVYVSNNLANSVTVVDADTNQAITTIAVGLSPEGLAVSPDNSRVYVANKGSGSISVIDVGSDMVLGSPITVGSGPVSIAISPDGQRAYVANAGSTYVTEIGGTMTLTIAKTGNGIGTVTSVPSGILCGASCQVRFTANTLVTLSAIAGSDSIFSGWGGDADCVDGSVTLSASRSCTVIFTSTVAPGGGGSSGSGGGGDDCFIATAAYGSSMAEEVVTLRHFRDDHLMKSRAGREFVRLYYSYSPAVADYIREHDSMRAAARMGLWPAVFVIKHPWSATMTILVLAFLIFWTTKHLREKREQL